ncbi:tyrosinase family protein [Tahibacter amnicola]|uniref:Tyrosinase family protein n=1 Tax=Tahibacter amnicola TaxID=2976241 RepID=A0ABY6BGM4_9GAMM|nr:tyrosinase family protein [Tahibacter amnicola]UXI69014.1 tyrosinase family protein [Tahibacter amnicola]
MATRRTVLKTMLTSGVAVAFCGSLDGLAAFVKSTLRVRRSLHGMALDDPDLDAYRSFVGTMQGYDQTKPVSWLGYSLQHGEYDGDYKYCPHGDWYFLPWHREYVLMYENAVRAITGHDGFAMPFWDWTVDRVLPAAFTEPTYNGKPNPLYVKDRTLSNPQHWPLPDRIVGPDVMKAIYAETDFQLFGTSKNPEQDDLDMSWVVAGGGTQGILERTPHNTVHNWIGAFMPTAGSPRDPIFFMHHSNIDRIWAYWNALGRSNTSGMDADTQRLWLQMNFKDNYLRPDGTPYSVQVIDVQDTEALGYTYEGLPKADFAQTETSRNNRLLSLFATGAGMRGTTDGLSMLPTTNTVPATPAKPLVQRVRMHGSTRQSVLSASADSTRRTEVFALIKDMQATPNIEGVRVFVNAENLTASTPDTDPHFVTEIAFLKHGKGGHHKAPPSALVDLTPALRKLGQQGALKDDTVSVHLLPILREGTKANGEQVVPASVEIAVL